MSKEELRILILYSRRKNNWAIWCEKNFGFMIPGCLISGEFFSHYFIAEKFITNKKIFSPIFPQVTWLSLHPCFHKKGENYDFIFLRKRLRVKLSAFRGNIFTVDIILRCFCARRVWYILSCIKSAKIFLLSCISLLYPEFLGFGGFFN